MVNSPAAFGVDDIAGLLFCPGANRVLRVGHSNRAQMGHSCQAPRPTAAGIHQRGAGGQSPARGLGARARVVSEWGVNVRQLQCRAFPLQMPRPIVVLELIAKTELHDARLCQ